MGLSPVEIFTSSGLERAEAVIAAVSGGSDSLALLFLLKDYLATLDRPPILTAVTIDHRLRPESAKEAEDVGRLCQKYGIGHRVLAWEDVKPVNGIAAAARTARYRLLVQAAREAGAAFIATGHTQDDQIETFLMRKERSSHSEARGLAAMAVRARLERTVELVRPLLGVSRQALRTELAARGISWVDDPSNANTDYERPRVRLGVAADADTRAVLEQVALASAARKRDNAALIAALAEPSNIRVDDSGSILVDPLIYAGLPESARRLFSGLLASLAGGRRFLPGDGERSRIERVLTGQEQNGRLTIFGALIERGAEDAPHIFRRERRNLSRALLQPGQSAVWDGRFRFFNGTVTAMEIAAPGRQELSDFLNANEIEIESRKREGLLVSPAVYAGGRLAALPFVQGGGRPDGVHIERHFALFDHVLPGYDFDLAQAVEMRIGRQCPEIS
ncbi:tRNA lysidine(34) synthetase TilS [Ochrobactrum sp. CM-21-5]|nr:tRNA lysidine(34) synthetase TilS [Ochrobactrum sp. CM-21-5]